MSKVIKSIFKNLFIGALIVIVGLLTVNNSIYLHTHKLADGSIVTHAHPFDKTKDTAPIKSHHHTKPEFFLLQNLQLLFFILFVPLILLSNGKKVIQSISKNILYHFAHFFRIRNRAPPIKFF